MTYIILKKENYRCVMIHDKRSSTKYWEDRGYTVVILETKD